MKRKLIVLFCLVISFGYLSAQEKDNLPYFIPPSPIAYELGKYGQIPVGMFTGTTIYNLPLYTYKTKNLSVPISISYNSNGIKVDQLETNVGLGWSLNAGGVISRIVRDKPDDENLSFYPEEEFTQVGTTSPLVNQYLYDAANSSDNDTETDLFMFNFAGKSGKFVYDKNKKILQMPFQDLKIEPDGNYDGYIITTSDGVKYYFYEKETSRNIVLQSGHQDPEFVTTAWYLSKIEHPAGDIINFTYENIAYHYICNQSQTFRLLYPNPQIAFGQIIQQAPYLSPIIQNRLDITGKKLVKIESNIPENGKVNFTTNISHPDPVISNYKLLGQITVADKNSNIIESFIFNYHNTTNKRVFLTSITYKDPNKFYGFTYIDPDLFPHRLSLSQDHWGYYNGANNNIDFVPTVDASPFENFTHANRESNGSYAKIGLLNKITYPTKGSTEITYEPNSYWGEEIIPGHKEYIALESNDPQYTDEIVITSVCNQWIEIWAGAYFEYGENCQEPTDHERALFYVHEGSNNIPLYIITQYGNYIGRPEGNLFQPNGQHNNCFAYLQAGHTYKLSIKPASRCTFATANIHYTSTLPAVSYTNIMTGGIRVQKTIDKDNLNSPDVIKRYYYGSMNDPNKSSGYEAETPFYVSDYIVAVIEPPLFYNTTFKLLVSSSLTPLFNTGNNNVYYENVTVSLGGDNFENGGEEHDYIVNWDEPANVLLNREIYSAPMSNVGWNNGLESKTIFFKKDQAGNKIIVKEIINQYQTDPANYGEVYGYTIRKAYDLYMTSPVCYTCKQEDLTKEYTWNGCATIHKHTYFQFYWGTRCIAPGNNNVNHTTPHPCFGKSVGYQINNLISLANIDAMVYKNYSYWSYLKSSTTKQFDENGQNPIISTTTYSYENPAHIQLTKTETTASNGDVILNKIYYPEDLKNNNDHPFMQDLLNQYRIAEPVKKQTWVNNELKSTVVTDYWHNWDHSSLLLPQVIKSSFGTGNLIPKVRFYDYGLNGNVLNLSKENDIHIAYYWAYNQTQPVVKADNVSSYTDFLTAIGDATYYASTVHNPTHATRDLDILLNWVGDLTDNQQILLWNTFNTSLRNNPLLSNSIVSTFTYKSMVGLTSSTDQNGNTQYYEYDSYNRLSLIRDMDGNIIQKYTYNYSTN